MQHGVHFAEFAAREALVEVGLVEVVADLRAGQVPVLLAVGQVVHGDHIIDADGVQTMDKIAADHAGGACDDHFHLDGNPSCGGYGAAAGLP